MILLKKAFTLIQTFTQERLGFFLSDGNNDYIFYLIFVLLPLKKSCFFDNNRNK